MKEEIILGIDPGTIYLGYSVIKKHGKDIEVLTLGTIDLKKEKELKKRVKIIYEKLKRTFEAFKPHVVSIEDPFFGKNVQAMLKLGMVQGVVMSLAFKNNCEVYTYSPREIKKSVVGTGAATKEKVAKFLEIIFGISFDSYTLDATDALSVAYGYTVLGKREKTPKRRKSKGWSEFLKENKNLVEHEL